MTKISHLFLTDDLKKTVKTKEELKKQITREHSMMMSIWNLDLTRMKNFTQEGKISSLEKFNTRHQLRYTRTWIGKTYKYLGGEQTEFLWRQ
jgi:hypothetical protein